MKRDVRSTVLHITGLPVDVVMQLRALSAGLRKPMNAIVKDALEYYVMSERVLIILRRIEALEAEEREHNNP